MNKWAERSALLAGEADYLDRLQGIYKVAIPKVREIPPKALNAVKEALAKKDKIALLNLLLDLKRFPYDESYAKFLRTDRGAIARNPKTVDRICKTLFLMGESGVIAGITTPKKANQQRGNEFKTWAMSKFAFTNIENFKAAKNRIVFLDASDTDVRNYANAILHAGLEKRPDFVAKSYGKHVVGEAKFLADEGGNQRGAFRNAMDVAGHPSGQAFKVAVLDGVIWIKGSSFYRLVETSSLYIFSALLKLIPAASAI